MALQLPSLSPIPSKCSRLTAGGGGGREVAKPQSKSHIAPQELTSYRIDTSVGIQHEKQGNRKRLTSCYKPMTCVLNTVRQLGWGVLGQGRSLLWR